MPTAGYVFTGFWCLHMCRDTSDPPKIQVGPALPLGSALATRTSGEPTSCKSRKTYVPTHTYTWTHTHTWESTRVHAHAHVPGYYLHAANVLMF